MLRKNSLNEGHGFSRAIKATAMRALAAATEGRTDVFPRGIRLAPEVRFFGDMPYEIGSLSFAVCKGAEIPVVTKKFAGIIGKPYLRG
jgi:hypothetical protein